jgi:hypothetical protein
VNVTNRKMFRPRNARNKLNQLGGIMASSPELMQTIQRFQLGGDVNVRPGTRPTVMGMGSGDLPNVSQIMDFLGLSSPTEAQSSSVEVDPTLAEMQRANDPRFFNRLGANLLTLPAAAYDTAVGLPAAAVQNAATAFQYSPFGRALGLSEPGAQQPPYVGSQVAQPMLQDVFAANVPLTPEQVALRSQSAGAEDVAMSQQLGQDVFGEGYEMPGTVDPFMMPGATPSPEMPVPEAGAEESAVVEPAPAPVSPEIEAAKRGELGPQAQVQAVVAAGTPAEQQDQLQQLMNEFTSKAPQYEGLDKGLALAKIGFAMAAGKSPRALENIANALNQGADTFIKDKQERNAFNRQVQLSALQYGLGEVGKERAEARLEAREGRKPNYFYADEPLVYNGVSYDIDDLVVVSTQDLREKGPPKGVITPERVKALTEREIAVSKALNDAVRAKVLEPDDSRKEAEIYQSSVKNVIGTEVAVGLLENGLVDVVEGKVTGLAPAFRDIVRQGANFFGIDPGTEYKGLAEARAGMRLALQKAVPVTVGSAQSANSISDRDVDLLVTALFGENALTGGPFTFVTEDPTLMGQRLQRAIQEMRTGQRSELASMQSVETRIGNMYAPGSTLGDLRPATEVIAPFQQQFREAGFGRTQAGLVKGEDGIFRFQ